MCSAPSGATTEGDVAGCHRRFRRCYCGQSFLLIAREAAEGTFFTFGPDARLLPTAAEIVALFRDEEAYEPKGFTLYAYAAVQAWAQSVETAGRIETAAVTNVL